MFTRSHQTCRFAYGMLLLKLIGIKDLLISSSREDLVILKYKVKCMRPCEVVEMKSFGVLNELDEFD